MKTEFVIFLLMTMQLVMVLLVRSSPNFSYVKFGLITISSFFAAQLLLSGLTNAFDLDRASSMEGVVQGLLKTGKQEPSLLIVGSSYTSRALDGERFEKMLANEGIDNDVLQLSYPGSFAHENDYFMDEYFDKIDSPPKSALVEIGTEKISEYKPENRMGSALIRFHDTARISWMLRLIWFDPSETDIIQRLSLSRDVLEHYVAHLFHLGLLLQIEPSQEVSPRSGFYPDDRISSEFDLAHADSVILKIKKISTTNPPASMDFSVKSRYRFAQKERLHVRGVSTVIFYQTPMLDTKRLDDVSRLCAELGDDCIAVDVDLWNRLDRTMWTDMGHLNTKGGEVFGQWLANRAASRMEASHAIQ